VNRLVAGAKGTSNYVQLNFDDIGLSIDTVNYELDLEVQWVNANYTRTNEYLCIRTGTLNSENLQVDVWTGSSWTTVMTALTANAWNNVSVSDYLTSSTFTIRFKGTEETNDATQSSWQIDCVLLHTWSVADTIPPTYSNVGTNTTKAGQPCLFSVKWTDNVGLSSFIFGWNASGTWQNDTKVTLSGTAAWSNVSKVLPLADAVIGWRIWCNDTSNNWNDTGIQVLITSGATVQPIDTVKPSEMTVYMQEQRYSFIEPTVQTYSLQYWIEGIQQFYETFTETAKSADMLKYWMELSQAFYEPFKPSASTSYSAEALSVIVQTVKPSEVTIYWQEQVYVYPQTTKPSESHPISGEGVYALSQTLKPSEQNLYGGEGQNIMVQTITSTGSVKYWQEQQYFTVETAKTSSILNVLKEIAEAFITQVETLNVEGSLQYSIVKFTPPAGRLVLAVSFGCLAIAFSIAISMLFLKKFKSQRESIGEWE
jgi:hypothetical protein